MQQRQGQKLPEEVADYLKKLKEDTGWNEGKTVEWELLGRANEARIPGTSTILVGTDLLEVSWYVTEKLEKINGVNTKVPNVLPVIFKRPKFFHRKKRQRDLEKESEQKAKITLIRRGAQDDRLFDYLALCEFNETASDQPWHKKPQNGYKFKMNDLVSKANKQIEERFARNKAIGLIPSNEAEWARIAQAIKFSDDLAGGEISKGFARYDTMPLKALYNSLCTYCEQYPKEMTAFLSNEKGLEVRLELNKWVANGDIGYDLMQKEVFFGKSKAPIGDFKVLNKNKNSAWKEELVGYLIANEDIYKNLKASIEGLDEE